MSGRPRLRKTLGQHHLRDGRLCRPLIDYLEPAGQTVFEIGPGGGVLTRELLAAGAEVVACELDLAWAFHLRRVLAGPVPTGPESTAPALSIVALDALDLPFARLPAATLVAGNLPFQVGTALVGRLLEEALGVPRMAFMVQKEVAERLVASPGTKAYGALTVRVAARAEATLLGVVKPGSFHPPPKVAAAFVGLERRDPPLPEAAMPVFRDLVHNAFAQRRKTLRNNLVPVYGRDRAAAAIAAAGVDPGRRAETLGLGELVALYRMLEKAGPPET